MYFPSTLRPQGSRNCSLAGIDNSLIPGDSVELLQFPLRIISAYLSRVLCRPEPSIKCTSGIIIGSFHLVMPLGQIKIVEFLLCRERCGVTNSERVPVGNNEVGNSCVAVNAVNLSY